MNKMKKTLMLVLSLAMSATLVVACNDNKGGDKESSTANVENSSLVESEVSEEESSTTQSSEELTSEDTSSEDVSSEEETSSEESSEEEKQTYNVTFEGDVEGAILSQAFTYQSGDEVEVVLVLDEIYSQSIKTATVSYSVGGGEAVTVTLDEYDSFFVNNANGDIVVTVTGISVNEYKVSFYNGDEEAYFVMVPHGGILTEAQLAEALAAVSNDTQEVWGWQEAVDGMVVRDTSIHALVATAISSAEELATIEQNGNYFLASDIDFTGKEMIKFENEDNRLTGFQGSIDGRGYTITVAGGDVSDEGLLFWRLDNATIKNVKLDKVNISQSPTKQYRVVYAGAIAGMTKDCTVSDCEIISGTVTSSSALFKTYSGGIAAFAFNSNVSGCKVNANISATASTWSSRAGGILAYTGDGTVIKGCTVNGTISSISTDGNTYTGGIVGYLNNSVLSHCQANTTVTSITECSESENGKSGAAYSGGIAGYVTNSASATSSISVSYSTGTVKSSSVDYSAYSGGIAAYTTHTLIKQCYSTASVTAESNISRAHGGGIVATASVATTFDSIIFDGNVEVLSSTGNAKCGVISAYDSTAAENSVTYNHAFYVIRPSETQIKANGKNYNPNDFDEKVFLIRGTSHSQPLYSENILINSLGWSADDWSFSISSYPTVKS